ncbi:MAG: T9SS type A sorting domain-containing protein [Bacteroidetes bacterium]|nr:T9SS type A sorting domain-containing protein [Bacteroidota bacterium]
MKKLLPFFIVFYFTCNLFGQNLVPNPNLEDTVFCPWAENQLPLSWVCFGRSPDYLNSCSSALNVPNTPTGYHPAHSGVGMIGVFTYVNPSSSGWPDYREFVGIQLASTLSVGQKYYMSFFMSFARRYPIGMATNAIGTDKLGLKFSTVPYSETTPPALDNFSHLYTDSIYTDTLQWIKVSGSFIADSAYNYLMLGNFFDEANTDTLYFGGPNNWTNESYYFLDDICVTTDSMFNETWTGINDLEQNNEKLNIYPNPSNDIIKISTTSYIEEIYLTNCLGQTVYQAESKNKNTTEIDISAFSQGLYILKIKTENSFYSRQILISH